MGTTPVTCETRDGIATITLDDGRANVLTLHALEALHDAFAAAEADGGPVVLTGREGRFSAGFDLGVLGAFGPDAPRLLRAGFELSHRMLAHPQPVVVACTGHAFAMGAFLLLSGDLRIGVAGADHRITANEVAIGMTMPRSAVEICRQRLTRTHFDRAVILAEEFNPEGAVAAGFLDRVVAPADLHSAARQAAATLGALDPAALAATKLRARADTLEALRAAIEADDADFCAAVQAPV
jgi:enoyl-CoA hydratase